MVAFAFVDAPAVATRQPSRGAILSSRRVFIARKEPTDRRFSSAFRAVGATVSVGDGPSSAVRAIRGGRLDAVVLDATDAPDEAMTAARTLRCLGHEGLIFAVCDETSAGDTIAWTVEAGVDALFPATVAPADLPRRLADHLLRNGNAAEAEYALLSPTLR